MKVDELAALGGKMPPGPDEPPNAETVDEMVRLYYEVYVPGLATFFESTWYNLRPQAINNPLSTLRDNKPVLNLFAIFLQTISSIQRTDQADMVYSGHLETCVVWALAKMPHSMASNALSSNADSLPAEDDLREIQNRLVVFETLLSGEPLHINLLTPPPSSSSGNRHWSQRRVNELEFWYQLAQYLQQPHSSDASARERCLSRMRAALDGHENRDVLYSIAVLREFTPQYDVAMNEQTMPVHLDETDPRSKLAVATRFIRDEAASTGGTTNVIRRFADLAYRAFVRPGVNVRQAVRR
jgi:hypothetical protein